MGGELARLTERQHAAEAALFARLADDFYSHRISFDELMDAFRTIRGTLTSGWTARWDAELPGTRGMIAKVLSAARLAPLREPNAACGSWRGPWPLGPADPRPRRGQPVVYILYDAAGLCYYGSSGSLLNRLDQHQREGRAFSRWCAYPCATRELAYRIEDRLLKRRLPPGNVRAGR